MRRRGFVGERALDLANLFFTPDAEAARAPGRLTRLTGVVSDAARVERERLLRWVIAYAGLSAAWLLEDGDDATPALAAVGLAVAFVEDVSRSPGPSSSHTSAK